MKHFPVNSLAEIILIATVCFTPILPQLICADSLPKVPASARQTVRDLEMKIELKPPQSKTVELTITNRTPEPRFLRVPLDLTLFRINLTDENGKLLKMTHKGVTYLTEPAIGSVMLYVLENGKPRSTSIDLGPLFDFPPDGTIRCEVSRRVHFANPREHPLESEWMKFPPVNILLGTAIPPPIPRRASAPIIAPGNSMAKTWEKKRIAHLEHTMHLLCGSDGGLIGAALHMENLSETDSIKLRREEDGNAPLNVSILDEENKQVTLRTTAPMPLDKPGGSAMKINWTLGPGESRWFFLPVQSLFHSLPSWERIEGCKVVVSAHGIEPPEELLATARKRKASGDADEMRMNLLGIDESFRPSVFSGVAITKGSLQADAEKAYSEARREIDDAGRGSNK